MGHIVKMDRLIPCCCCIPGDGGEAVGRCAGGAAPAARLHQRRPGHQVHLHQVHTNWPVSVHSLGLKKILCFGQPDPFCRWGLYN